VTMSSGPMPAPPGAERFTISRTPPAWTREYFYRALRSASGFAVDSLQEEAGFEPSVPA
jgi:hypothetical protein